MIVTTLLKSDFSFKPYLKSKSAFTNETQSPASVCGFSPGLQTPQSFVDVLLMELGHVCVHLRIVVPDVPLRAAVWDGAEPERRREVVWTLELKEENEAWSIEVKGRREDQG